MHRFLEGREKARNEGRRKGGKEEGKERRKKGQREREEEEEGGERKQVLSLDLNTVKRVKTSNWISQ